MNQARFPSSRSFIGLAVGLTLALGACGKSSSSGASGGSGGSSGGGGNSGGGGGSSGGTATGCADNKLAIVFSPMYSAFDGVHHFQIPVVVTGIETAMLTMVNWSASDPSMVAIAPDDSTGGAMITTQKAGQVSIIANLMTPSGTMCGAAQLTIAAATSDDWEVGSARYNDGVVITRPPIMRDGGMREVASDDAGADASDAASPREAACTNCHGDTANGPYKTVQHTPEQTGGFSDADLENIFRHGMVPMGGYFDASIVRYSTWQSFHQWQMTDDQAKGIITYLRSLAPAKQTGSGNFGGRFDGGPFDRPPREGGGGRFDAGTSDDAAPADAAAE